MSDFVSNESYVESVLRRYNVQGIKKKFDGFMALCPIHKEKHRSFSIRNDGLWFCWSCKAGGNIMQLHAALGGGKLDWRESLKAMGAQLGASEYQIVGKVAKTKMRATIPLPGDFKLYDPDSVPEYIANRLNWNTIAHFGLGSSDTRENWQRCVIPIRHLHEVVGYHSRALSPEMEPRYYNPYNFLIKSHVFGYDECGQGNDIIVVEGAFNAMSMWEKGFNRTMAVFGTMFTTDQLCKILTTAPKTITICFDRDPSNIRDGKEIGRAGQRATKSLGGFIKDAVPTYIMPLPLGKDPNELTRDALTECYKRRVAYDSIFREPGAK